MFLCQYSLLKMYYYTLLFLIIITFVVCEESKVSEGNACGGSNGTVGNCTEAEDCRETVHSTRDGRSPGVCGSEGSDPVICCINHDDDVSEDIPKDNISKEDVPKDEGPKEDLPKDDVPKEDVPKDDVPKENIPKDDVPKEDAPKVDVSKDEVPKIDVPKDDIPKDDAPKIDVPKQDVPKVDVPKDDIPKDDIPKEGVPKVDVLGDDVPVNIMPTDDARFQSACEPGSPNCPSTRIHRGSRAEEKCAEYHRKSCYQPIVTRPQDQRIGKDRQTITRAAFNNDPETPGPASNHGPAAPGVVSNHGPAAPGVASNYGPAAPGVASNYGPAAPGVTSNYGPAAPGVTSNYGPAAPIVASNYGPVAPGVASNYGPVAPGVASNYGPAAPIVASNYGPVAPGVASNYGPAAPGVTSNYGPAAPGVTSNYGPAAPIVASNYGPVAPGVASNYGPVAPGVSSNYGPAAPIVASNYGPVAPGVASNYGPVAPGVTSNYGPAVPGVAINYGPGAPGVANNYGSGSPGLASTRNYGPGAPGVAFYSSEAPVAASYYKPETTGAEFKFDHGVPGVADGIDSRQGEFPHMALLGYGQNISAAEWNCGGSIISETFILTAGHCTSGRDIGPVKFAATGILRRSHLHGWNPVQQSGLHDIKRIIKHPDYNPPHKYNDIALLETQTVILVKPVPDVVSIACLNFYDTTAEDATVTGWGTIEHRGMVADVLQRAQIHRFSDDVCAKKYPPSRLLKHGFDNKTQMCYGHQMRPRDTCQGDSGGPLQIRTDEFPCLYTVIGVTSFGRACGTAGEPGIYTRVSPYVPWIESVVWPSP